MLKPLLIACQFLTRLPLPAGTRMPDDIEQGESLLFYPLVGLLIGLLMWLTAMVTSGGDPLLQAALILVVWVALTGGLHLDGLADMADAWIGGQGDPGRTLQIMKDPTSGPIAIATVVLLLLVKFTALHALLLQAQWAALLLVPMIGRASLVAAFLYLPYIRPDGLGAALAMHLPATKARTLLLLLALLCLVVWGLNAVPILALTALLFIGLRKALIKRIGGLTGDAAGAICELSETIALVAAALLL